MKNQLCLIMIISTHFLSVTDSELELRPHEPHYIALFSHGLIETRHHAHNFSQEHVNSNSKIPASRFILMKPYATFDYPDARKSFPFINPSQTSLAQDNEIECLNHAYHHVLDFKKNNKSPHIVLVGVSRGASTIVSFMATRKPRNVSALVLQSPFDCANTIACCQLERIFKLQNPKLSQWAEGLLEIIFGKYHSQGLSPIQVCNQIPLCMPILIVCSKQDTTVPCASSIALYQSLRDSGHYNTYLLLLERGVHSNLLHGPDGQKYHEVAHAFYQKFGLPHDPQAAARGAEQLALCKPTIE